MVFDALVVVDCQAGLLADAPYRADRFLHTVQHLLTLCRAHSVPCIYVQHDGGAGDVLAHGTPGWEIVSALAPLPGEVVLEKHYNSAFCGTALRSILDSLHAKRLLLCGMQTEHCIDATCKAAFEHGYAVTIVRGSTTTFDNGGLSAQTLCAFYEDRIWNGRYASVIEGDALPCEFGAPQT